MPVTFFEDEKYHLSPTVVTITAVTFANDYM